MKTITVRLIITLVLLYCFVYFGFAIRDIIPSHYNYFYLLGFLTLYILLLSFSNKFFIQIISHDPLRKLLITVFILLNSFLLYSISSINRENEIKKYFAKNEVLLQQLVDSHKLEKDNYKTYKSEGINAEFFHKQESLNQIRLYTCAGYGYEIIHSEVSILEKPKVALGGSPIVNWINIKDHWYYCSFFD